MDASRASYPTGIIILLGDTYPLGRGAQDLYEILVKRL
jgi:hypothetical protein